jgi:maltokinase
MHVALADPRPQAVDDAFADAAFADAAFADETYRLAVEGLTASMLAASRGRIAERMEPLRRCTGTPLIPVHGDFHVGQILRDERNRLFVIDFDGNPTLPPAQRLAWQPAALDVAGMLMSLENVGYVVCKHNPQISADVANGWSGERMAEFLTSYRGVLAAAGRGDLLDEALLDAYIWQQISREANYAEQHLSRWAYVPTAALNRRFQEAP